MIYNKSWEREYRFQSASRIFPRDQSPFCVPRIKIFEDITQSPPMASDISLYECAEKMVKSLPERLSVLYSGGTDSTLALVSCVYWRGAVKILYGSNALQYTPPILMEWLKSRGCTFQHVTPTTIKDHIDGHLVTGSHGDSLLLGVIIHSMDYDSIWNMSIEQLFINWHGSEYEGIAGLKHAKPIIDQIPIELNTPNLMWWLDFTCIWYWEDYYMSARSNFGRVGNTHTHFFGSTDFQSWAIKDVSKRVGNTYSTYKIKFHELIWELVGSKIQLPQKTPEIGDVINRQTNNMDDVIAITDDWQFIRVSR